MERMRIDEKLGSTSCHAGAPSGSRLKAEIEFSSRGDTRVRSAVHVGYARPFRITYTCGRPCTRNRSVTRLPVDSRGTKEQLGRHTAIDMDFVVAHSSGLDADPHRREYTGN